MSVASDLLKADHVGIRNFKDHLSKETLGKLLVITDRGNPVSYNIPAGDMMELIDILEETFDSEVLGLVKESRDAVERGAKPIPVSNLFKKIRKSSRN